MNAELEDILQAAARAVPPTPYDRDAISHRGKMRRRRRNITIAGAAATVLAIAVALPIALRPGSAKLPIAEPSPTPSPVAVVDPADPQRMMIVGGTAFESPGQPGVLWAQGELLANGTLKSLPKPKGKSGGNLSWRFAPDGGYAVHDIVTARVNGEDSPCNPGQEPLVLINDKGKETYRTDVHQKCKVYTLLGVDSKNAYLQWEGTFSAFNLATKKVTVLSSATFSDMYDLGITGSTIYTIHQDHESRCERPCTTFKIRTYDIVTGKNAEHIVTTKASASGGMSARLSADGKHLAISYTAMSTSENDSFAIIDLVNDKVLLEHSFDPTSKQPAGIVGLAWNDNSTLKVAYYLAPLTGRKKMIDVLQVAEFNV